MIKDLTKGSIVKNLINVSLPIMGASLFQMAYQIIDMFWLGKLNSDSVAAVGTAGFYIGLSYALASIAFIGVGIKVAQSIGKGRKREAFEYVTSAMVLIGVISLLITVTILLLRDSLIGLFNISSDYISRSAISYLSIVTLFSVFKNINMTFNRAFIGFGSGKTPFIIGTVSLIINIILDPILIFGYSVIPSMGVNGAAYATVIAQCIATVIYVVVFLSNSVKESIKEVEIRLLHIKEIILLSYPVAIQRVIFTSISIVIGKIISNWGTDAIAIQKIGVQLESLSWVTAGGMQAAITSFIGQNYGAGKIRRLKRGYFTAIGIMSGVGSVVSLLFFIFPEAIFTLFVKEPDVISGGVSYLRILAISQLFMCIDITTMGAFNGIGRTGIPPINSITLTSIRIPLAILLSTTLGMGVSGVWLSISLTTVLKGTILMSLFLYIIKRIDSGKKI